MIDLCWWNSLHGRRVELELTICKPLIKVQWKLSCVCQWEPCMVSRGLVSLSWQTYYWYLLKRLCFFRKQLRDSKPGHSSLLFIWIIFPSSLDLNGLKKMYPLHYWLRKDSLGDWTDSTYYFIECTPLLESLSISSLIYFAIRSVKSQYQRSPSWSLSFYIESVQSVVQW